MTRTFIGHTFGEAVKRLARDLNDELADAGIDGYLAEDAPRYSLLIHDKIRQAIDGSDRLVAVITENTQRLASVQEEIGYAFGRGAEVAIMLEEGVEGAGVLVHGHEVEEFTIDGFRASAWRVAKYIQDSPAPAPSAPSRLSEGVERLLAGRHVLSEDSEYFARNRHYDTLYGGILDGLDKPAVLFTACPRELGGANTVTTAEFVEWAKGIRSLDADGHRIPVQESEHRIGIGSLTLAEGHPSAPPSANVRAYREFQDTGFFEYGTSYPYFGAGGRGGHSLYLYRVAGEFWGFLLHARLFYRRMGMGWRPFRAVLSIRKSSTLGLGNWGDEALSPQWRLTRDHPSSPRDPRTDQKHIQLRRDFGSADGMADPVIADAARETARNLCNAYGETAARCYDESGRFAWDLWRWVSQ